jgi:Ca2+-binding EF-hand superfamily protein
LKQALDSICQKNAGISEFNPEVAEELWMECDKNTDGSVTLRTFISVVVRAQSILKENVAKAEAELGSGVAD